MTDEKYSVLFITAVVLSIILDIYYTFHVVVVKFLTLMEVNNS
jgi:hypothetical protein